MQTQSLADHSDQYPAEGARPTLHTLADQDWIQSGLAVLSPNIRQTFLMVFLEGRTCRETAETLHIPIGTVLSRLDSARHSLRTAMGNPPVTIKNGRDESAKERLVHCHAMVLG
jgi:DNA-directed RNA polymerase specialized sigma24 family protein